MNHSEFYSSVRHSLFAGKLTQDQVVGTNFLLDAIEEEGDIERNHAAYMLATAFWETPRTMEPVRETLAKSDDQAIRVLDTAFGGPGPDFMYAADSTNIRPERPGVNRLKLGKLIDVDNEAFEQLRQLRDKVGYTAMDLANDSQPDDAPTVRSRK